MSMILDFVASGLMANRAMERNNSSIFSSIQPSVSPVIRDYTINTTIPTERSGHAIVHLSGNLYMFGGVDTAGAFLADLWVLNLTTTTWKQLAPSGIPPSARAGHGMFVFGSRIYILAGNSAADYLNDLISYDSVSNSWTTVPTTGIIQIRAYFAHCIIGNTLFVLGGMKGTGANDDYGDVRKLNLSLTTPVWTLTRSGAFTGRCRFSAVPIGTLIYFFAGTSANGNLRTDMRTYNTITNAASAAVNITGTNPGGRVSYNMAVSGALIYIYGGSNLTAVFNTTHILDTTTLVWSLSGSTELSYARCLAASAQNDSIMYVDDGATSIAATTDYSETWSMDLSLQMNTQLPTKQIYVSTTSFTYLGVTFSVLLQAGNACIRMTLPSSLSSIASTLSLKGLRIDA